MKAIFLIALFSVSPSFTQAKLVDKTVALVNGDLILQSDIVEFQKTFSLRREIDPLVGLTQFSAPSTNDILQYLIQETLILQKSAPTEEEIEEEINAVQRNNKISREQLKEVLHGQGVSFEIYRKLMSVSVAKRKLVDRELRPLAAVSDEEVKNHYYTDSAYLNRRKEQKLVLSYSFQQLIIPNSKLADATVKRLQSGEDLDSLSTSLANDGVESTKLSSISEESLNSNIKQAIQGLRVGEITKPIPAGSGYLVLRITSIGAPRDPDFEKEKEKIRATIFQKSLLNQLKRWTDPLHGFHLVNSRSTESFRRVIAHDILEETSWPLAKNIR